MICSSVDKTTLTRRKNEMEEKLTFRLSKLHMDFLKRVAFERSSPARMVKPHEVLRDLIDQAIKDSQSEQREAA